MTMRRWIPVIALLLLTGWRCAHDKYPLPSIPPADDRYGNIGKEVYNLIHPVLDAAGGWNFSSPRDIYFGVDNFLYVCDSGNNRIVMLDAGGGIQGYSQYIAHPEAISQNDSLQLLIVNKTNRVYRIDLYSHNHHIDSAPVEVVFEQLSEPDRQFTGVSVHNGFEYYVTVVDIGDSSTNYKEFSFIYDFEANHTLKGPLPLHANGTGLFSAIVPTAIISVREAYLDISARMEDTQAFWFTQKGRTSLLYNSFKVQHVTTRLFEGQEILIPNTGYIETLLYDPTLFYWPEDVALDRQGFIFVVESGDGAGSHYPPGFYRFAASGKLMQSVLGFGSEPKRFNNPCGIAVSPAKEDQIVYVADTGNNRIMMFRLSTQ